MFGYEYTRYRPESTSPAAIRCAPCAASHLYCDGGQPCERCVRRRTTEFCIPRGPVSRGPKMYTTNSPSPPMQVMLNGDLIIVRVSDSLARFLGRSAFEVAGQPLDALLGSLDAAKLRAGNMGASVTDIVCLAGRHARVSVEYNAPSVQTRVTFDVVDNATSPFAEPSTVPLFDPAAFARSIGRASTAFPAGYY